MRCLFLISIVYVVLDFGSRFCEPTYVKVLAGIMAKGTVYQRLDTVYEGRHVMHSRTALAFTKWMLAIVFLNPVVTLAGLDEVPVEQQVRAVKCVYRRQNQWSVDVSDAAKSMADIVASKGYRNLEFVACSHESAPSPKRLLFRYVGQDQAGEWTLIGLYAYMSDEGSNRVAQTGRLNGADIDRDTFTDKDYHGKTHTNKVQFRPFTASIKEALIMAMRSWIEPAPMMGSVDMMKQQKKRLYNRLMDCDDCKAVYGKL